jgi:hypothetical protein
MHVEVFLRTIAGRRRLIVIAATTAETGCTLRHWMVCCGGTVRNSLGDPIQFTYKEDGMDGAFIVSMHGDFQCRRQGFRA